MANIGYVRVSTTDQKTDRQLEGVALEKVFEDKASAADTARPQLRLCLDFVRQGDTLHVHSIDRLARNLQDLLRLLGQLTDKGVTVQFLKERLVFSGQDDPFQRGRPVCELSRPDRVSRRGGLERRRRALPGGDYRQPNSHS